MSDHNERACRNCGSYLHHENNCPVESSPSTAKKEDDYPGKQYQNLFNYVANELKVSLLQSEMQEIISIVCKDFPSGTAIREGEGVKEKVFKVIEGVKAQYPASIFPDGGTSPDAQAGTLARLICDNIKREMEIMFNDADDQQRSSPVSEPSLTEQAFNHSSGNSVAEPSGSWVGKEVLCEHCGDPIEHPICRNCEIQLTLPTDEY